jgi:glycosyltransferase involved in cell wall biosynthesis|tara:strand:- start:66 stop:851 length:786 start_codon:yes stop_codon:yes gene_type:complete
VNNKNKVSILMTIYNHQNYLEQSIKSILKQSHKNWELIACENGSTDNSRNILKNFKDKRIKFFFFKKNIGRTKCLNYALKKASGKYIAILDSDDVAMTNRFAKQIDYIEKKNFSLVGSWFSRIDSNGKIIQKLEYNMKNSFFIRKILFFNTIGHSTIMFKKNITKKVGDYPISFKFMQDYAFFLKVFKKFKVGIIQSNLTNCRYHHQDSETFRVSRSHLIENEHKKLLHWSNKNFNFGLFELFFYYYSLFKLKFKIIKKFF